MICSGCGANIGHAEHYEGDEPLRCPYCGEVPSQSGAKEESQ